MNKLKIVFYISIVVCLCFVAGFYSCKNPSSSGSSGEPGKIKGKISISGAFALYPLTVKWAEEFKKEYPDISFDISAGGAGKGMTDVLSNMVDLAMFSREISKEELEKGAWGLAVTKDAVLPTINKANPLADSILKRGLSKQEFIAIYITGNITTWDTLAGTGQHQKIHVYTRSDACGAAAMWAKYLGKSQEDLLGTGVFGDPGIADAIKYDKYGMGFNNVIYAYDIHTRQKYPGLEIIPIDINNNNRVDPEENFYGKLDSVMRAIKEDRYPSPPARDLYLVSKGKPQNEAVLLFLNWVLDKGQAVVKEAGYVLLSENKISHEKQKLEIK